MKSSQSIKLCVLSARNIIDTTAHLCLQPPPLGNLGKTRRLKQAKDEATDEIEKYRQEREKQFKDAEASVRNFCDSHCFRERCVWLCGHKVFIWNSLSRKNGVFARTIFASSFSIFTRSI